MGRSQAQDKTVFAILAVEANSGNDDPLISGLRALGHTVNTAAQSSGLGSIVKVPYNRLMIYSGGADPRREGIVLGDTITP